MTRSILRICSNYQNSAGFSQGGPQHLDLGGFDAPFGRARHILCRAAIRGSLSVPSDGGQTLKKWIYVVALTVGVAACGGAKAPGETVTTQNADGTTTTTTTTTTAAPAS